ncbi:unannotated protein [freshwater metagenome]|uniref:Unannotated protein n=1 Tax=freshwater metagenome TaxID=449393 RepID=A0A6J7QPD7_9ZZZZ|nr:hypothetical protein [Actinomycetota bacterium]MSY16759.1 hypothetical protein [Actinomycetota bacterium]MSY97990.1 hypothetical protein [Actinomycetota bacterium]
MATAKTPKTPETPDPNDPKERFRLALEAKNKKGGHSGADRDADTGGVKDESSKAGGKREHRRKSGSS